MLNHKTFICSTFASPDIYSIKTLIFHETLINRGGLSLNSRLFREQKTVEAMIKLYCKNSHKPDGLPCDKCLTIINYALKRVELCRFGATKPVCGRCRVHCYKPDMRKEIKNVMKTTGAKLMVRHPVMTLFHLIDMFRYR